MYELGDFLYAFLTVMLIIVLPGYPFERGIKIRGFMEFYHDFSECLSGGNVCATPVA